MKIRRQSQSTHPAQQQAQLLYWSAVLLLRYSATRLLCCSATPLLRYSATPLLRSSAAPLFCCRVHQEGETDREPTEGETEKQRDKESPQRKRAAHQLSAIAGRPWVDVAVDCGGAAGDAARGALCPVVGVAGDAVLRLLVRGDELEAVELRRRLEGRVPEGRVGMDSPGSAETSPKTKSSLSVFCPGVLKPVPFALASSRSSLRDGVLKRPILKA